MQLWLEEEEEEEEEEEDFTKDTRLYYKQLLVIYGNCRIIFYTFKQTGSITSYSWSKSCTVISSNQSAVYEEKKKKKSASSRELSYWFYHKQKENVKGIQTILVEICDILSPSSFLSIMYQSIFLMCTKWIWLVGLLLTVFHVNLLIIVTTQNQLLDIAPSTKKTNILHQSLERSNCEPYKMISLPPSFM